MSFTLASIAETIGGQLFGPAEIPVTGAASIAHVRPGEITFATNEQNWKNCLTSLATAAIVPCDSPIDERLPTIHVAEPEKAFIEIAKLFRAQVARQPIGQSPRASISPTAKIAASASIYPGAFIGEGVEIGERSRIMPNVSIMENCRIGNDVTIFPNAVLYENTVVGDRCLIHAGVVLGAVGFGYRTHAGQHHLSQQLGNVVLGTDVEIGANTTIDRGTYDSTTIGDGTKIDDQVMIGHNTQVGKHNLFCSQVGIAGSCRTGDYVVMAGQVGLADHLKIGDHVVLGAKAGVMHSIEPNQHYLGAPAMPIREQLLIFASMQKLPELRRAVSKLTKRIEELQRTAATTQSTPTDTSHDQREAA
jgi:UDP-3-O-[3-hydroxymyristoyl] glucosamine N-acyltransferase